jgi:predicted aspartyl protease
MPILHNLLGPGQAKKPDGKVVAVHPSLVLAQRGPFLQVVVSLPDNIAQELTKAEKPVPNPITGIALIDTGASSTCIDDEVAKQLGLPIIDVVNMMSASHACTSANVYPVKLSITGLKLSLNAPRCMGAALKSQGLLVLIGRDALARTTFIYNGCVGEFTLCV